MSDEIPVLDINAEDREAEALRYADAVAAWQARRKAAEEPNPTLREAIERGELTGSGVEGDPFVLTMPCEPVPCPEFIDVDFAPLRKFEWPCDRRDAHHPHPEDGCPGVGAHPLTQIGGGYKEEEI